MDKQQIGIIGKHILIANLIAADLEVAEPLRDRGIDLIVFRDGSDGGKFIACPIQLKTATDETFGLNEKYLRFPNLRIVHVWHALVPARAQIFALSYEEALSLLVEMKYSESPSWKNDRSYTTTKPSKDLKGAMERFLVKSPDEWPRRLGMEESTVASQVPRHF